MSSLGDGVLGFIKVIVFVWAVLTKWLYAVYTSPWVKRKAYSKIRATPEVEIKENDTEVVYKPAPIPPTPIVGDFQSANCKTMADAWSWAVSRYGSRNLLGTREILGDDDEVQQNGKMFRKLELGDYRWMTYEEVDTLAENLGRGLRVIGLNPSSRVCMYAETRAEWYVTAQACFKQSFPVVTLYTNLGDEAVQHGIVETEVSTVITSHELLPKFKTILHNTPSVKQIIYMDNPIKRTDTRGFREDVRLLSFWDIISLGKKTTNNNMAEVEAEPVPPTPSSPAIIMYTSGSTGAPKGVILTHQNMVSTLNSFLFCLPELRSDDIYIGYLPMAHVLELVVEFMMTVFGVSIGYSGPNTLTDKSTMIKRGQKGDATVLKPTFLFAVPLILDRIYKGVNENIKRKGDFFVKLFDFCIKYKLSALSRGEVTPIMDALIFKNVRNLIGGNVRLIFSGGAPLAPDTHDYLKAAFGAPVLQGYGLTETTACASIMSLEENSTGRVGAPVQGVNIKLINWEEGNYRVTDTPLPRGEIHIGGGNVASGYYKLEAKTKEEFYDDDNGRRWFRTGDIGQFEVDGTLRIIDRKKDLVKLQFGEYVSLGKVESVLKSCPVVDNVCIYGHSSKSYVVALICPNEPELKRLAAKFGKGDKELKELVEDKDLTGCVLREVVQHSKKSRLEKFEIPGAVTLCPEIWTPESELVTAAFKLKRKPLQEFYQLDLDRMYGD